MNCIVDERLSISKGLIGVLNPGLFEDAWVLNDIVNGSKPGLETQGLTAAVG